MHVHVFSCVKCTCLSVHVCISELYLLGFRAHQENRDQPDNLERKDLQVQLVFLVLKDPVVILVLM